MLKELTRLIKCFSVCTVIVFIVGLPFSYVVEWLKGEPVNYFDMSIKASLIVTSFYYCLGVVLDDRDYL